MAQEKSIDELERDVEQARARVAADLALLRAPETFEAARSGVYDAANGYKDQMRDRVSGYTQDMVDTLKAKAAANPLAVAAIGAGVAWKLYRHPPVTSLLVGLGVASLMRTDPDDDSMHPRRLMENATQRAMDFKERASAQVAELAQDATGAMDEKLHQWTDAAERAYEHAAERVTAMTGGSDASAQPDRQPHVVVATPPGAAPGFAETRNPEALGVSPSGMRAPTADVGPYGVVRARSYEEEHFNSGRAERRDAYLLGLAALAVGAAFGLSRLRSGDEEEYEAGDDRGGYYDAYDEQTTWRRL
jgi:hypothetical protein